MEFSEKLKELRRSRSLTQEELAEALYVSRTAISKWESGRGYPSIDSLKELSRFFNVTIDELICAREVLTAAEEEKERFIARNLSLLCGALDALTAVLLFLPVFGDGGGASVSLSALTGTAPWSRWVFGGVIVLTALSGLCGMVLSRFDRPLWNRRLLVTGMALSVAGVGVFLAARQPYPGLLCLALLVVKGLLLKETAGR